MNIGQLIASLGLDTSQFTAGLAAAQASMNTTAVANRKMQDSLSKMSTSLDTVGQKFRTFGYMASAVLTAPILLAAKSMGKAGIEFEASMTKIESLVGISKETVGEWSDEILRMGKEVAQSPNKLAESLYFVTSAGFASAEALELTRTAGLAASTGLGQATDVANMLTSALNAYKQSGETATHVMDVFTAAVREGKIEPEGFAAAMGSVLPISSAVGATLADVTAAMASMSLNGSNAAQSATYLRNILSKIMKPSDEGAAALARMGLSSEMLIDSIKSSGLLSTLELLRGKIDVYGETVNEVFPELRALIGFLSLTGENLEYNKEITDAITNSTGDFGDAVEIASSKMKWKYDAALAKITASKIKMGAVMSTILIPLMEKLANWVEKVSSWFNRLSHSSQNLVISFAAFLAAIGPLSLMFSLLLYSTSALVKGYGLLVTALAYVKTAFIGLQTALLLTPYGMLAALIGVLAGAYFLLHKRQTDLQKINKTINDQYGEQAGKVKELVWYIENENLSNAERLKAITDLKQIMPEYNATLTEEGTLINHNTAEIDKYLEALQKKIKMQVLQEEFSKKMADNEKARMASQRATFYYEDAVSQNKQNPGTWSQDEITKLKRQMNEYVQIYKESQYALDEFVRATGIAATQSANNTDKIFNGESLDDMAEKLSKLKGKLQDIAILTTRMDLGLSPIQEKELQIAVAKKNLEIEIDANKRRYYAWYIIKLEEELALLKGIKAATPSMDIAPPKFFYTAKERMKREGATPALGKWGSFEMDDETFNEPAHIAPIKTMNEALSEGGRMMREYGNALTSLGLALGAVFAGQEGAMLGFFSTILSGIQGIISELIVMAIAGELAWGALKGAGLVGVLFAGTVILGAIQAAMANARNAATSMASGGLAYGETLARVGDYSGASSNPEVIAPLSKLQSILKGGMQGEVRFVIEQDKLVGILRKADKRNNLY